MKFVDEVSISVASGNGGPGCVSFRKEAKVPRGGPDGGDGGKGGDVIFKVDSRLHSLLDFKYKRKYRAKNGHQGQGSNMSGQKGEDLIIAVPKGTVVKNSNGQVIVDLSEEQDYVFLKGGLGGKGNSFYKTSVHQAPEIAQKGMPGEEVEITLELKLLADIGIIGFPNVGKSTLISHISAAKPKIADYHFTTLVPNLGVVKYGNEANFVVADIPGLITDAHKGVGLGQQFLRHIERTKAFVHVIDVSELSGRDPYQDYVDINYELKMYDESQKGQSQFDSLTSRQQIVVFNKIDAVSEERLQEVREQFAKKGVEAFEISAATGKNIKELIFKMGDLVFKSNEELEEFDDE